MRCVHVRQPITCTLTWLLFCPATVTLHAVYCYTTLEHLRWGQKEAMLLLLCNLIQFNYACDCIKLTMLMMLMMMKATTLFYVRLWTINERKWSIVLCCKDCNLIMRLLFDVPSQILWHERTNGLLVILLNCHDDVDLCAHKKLIFPSQMHFEKEFNDLKKYTVI